MKTFRNAAIALLAGALLGFVPTYLQLRDARAQGVAAEERMQADISALHERAVVSDVHSRLGLLLVRLQQGDFDGARSLSTRVFDDASQAADQVEDRDAKRRLATVGESRDSVTAGIAQSDPATTDTVSRLFELLGGSLR